LKQAGYSTAAFVGAFVLDGRFGLNAGFEVYDDRMLGSGSNSEVVQRTAEQVLAPAHDWIGESGRTPWVRLDPSLRPARTLRPAGAVSLAIPDRPVRRRNRLHGCVLGAFLDRLRASGALEHTLLVIASDHGESLGEHGERTHGLFAYDATIACALDLLGERRGAARSLTRPVAAGGPHADDSWNLVGVSVPPAVDGRSLRAVSDRARSHRRPGTYFEALNANLTRGWAPLKGMVYGKWKVIDLPIPELYDVTVDAWRNTKPVRLQARGGARR
jgi:hypothetical protein